MRYYFDTEFREEPCTIDLISIGIVCEDDREFYAISNEYDFDKAYEDKWILDNVIIPMYSETAGESISDKDDLYKQYILHGKSRKKIKDGIVRFIGKYDDPEFYAYYCNYDWVVFRWLFGRMIDLPSGYPQCCNDLKILMNNLGLDRKWKSINCPDPENEHNALADARWNKELYDKIISI